MTRDEFEAKYSANSGIPQDKMAALGYRAVPRDCGEEGCQGWRMDFDLGQAQANLVRVVCEAAEKFGAECARRVEEAVLKAVLPPGPVVAFGADEEAIRRVMDSLKDLPPAPRELVPVAEIDDPAAVTREYLRGLKDRLVAACDYNGATAVVAVLQLLKREAGA